MLIEFQIFIVKKSKILECVHVCVCVDVCKCVYVSVTMETNQPDSEVNEGSSLPFICLLAVVVMVMKKLGLLDQKKKKRKILHGQ